MLFVLFIIHMHLLDLVLYKPLNFSGVPFNTTKPTPNGHNVGGYTAKMKFTLIR